MGVTQEQMDRADLLIARCQESIRKMNVFTLDRYLIASSFSGGTDTIHVEAGKVWSASIPASESWMTIQAKGEDYLVVRVHPNDGKEMRNGQVKVTMDKQLNIISVTQEPRPDTRRTLRIETEPAYATIWVDGAENKYVSPWSVEVGSGRHVVRIEKDGYASVDTVLVVEDDLSADILPMKFRLRKRFGVFRFQVEPEKGFRFTGEPTIELNRAPVRLGGRRNQYESVAPIQYYTLYEDGSIPVYPGRYAVSVHADNFKPFDRDVDMFEDTDTLMQIVLEARKGTLNVDDAGAAAGAAIHLDDEEIGIVPLSGYPVGIGEHVLTVTKEGHVAVDKTIPVIIRENELTAVNVQMARFGRYRFSSMPERAAVYVDGVLMGETPRECILLDGEHRIRVEKKGYREHEEVLVTECGDDMQERFFSLMQTYPLTVSSDIDSLKIVVRKGKEVFTHGEKTPAQVHLPFSKVPYRLELYSASRKRSVYRGPLRFNREDMTRHNVLTYSRGTFRLLDADAQFYKQGEGGMRLHDPRLKIIKFSLFPGFSMSLLDAGVFGMPQGQSLSGSLTDGTSALGVSFLSNGEFRIGGRILENVDISMLGTGSYYWNWNVLNLESIPSFMKEGYNYFGGLELSTRLPVIHLRIKAGWQQYKLGGGNLYGGLEDSYFTVSFGLALGDRSSKGENILRIW